MCNIAQASEEKGIEKGRKQERINIIQKMLNRGYSKETIIELLDYTEEEFIVAESQIFKL